jgi:hypothetical protein
MAAMGIKDVVLHCAAQEGDAHYATDLPWLRRADREDGLEAVLSAADEYGIRIYLYAYDDPAYWSNQTPGFYDAFLQKGIQVVDEVYKKYGHHKSLAGFHLSPEFFFPADDVLVSTWLDHYIKPFSAHVKKLNPHLLITTAPFVGSAFPYDSRQACEFWEKLLKDGGIDIMIPQDGIGADENIPGGSHGRSYEFIHTIFKDIATVCDKYNVTLWDDLESFQAVGVGLPPHYSRTIRQMEAASPYAKKFVAFEWLYLSPSSSVAAVEFKQNWKRYNEGQELIQMIRAWRPHLVTADGKREYVMAEGIGDPSSPDQFVTWTTSGPMDIILPLGFKWNDINGFAASFRSPDKTSSPIQEIEMYTSVDGKHFKYLTSTNTPNTEDGEIRIYGKFADRPAVGRYVKFRITPAPGRNTIQCGELAVFANASQWISKGCKYTFDVQPDRRVRDEGGKLTDWDDSRWIYAQVGWKDAADQIHVTLDLGRLREVDRVEAAFLKSEGDEPTRKDILGGFTVGLPKTVGIQYSGDGLSYSQIMPTIVSGYGENASYTYGSDLPKVKARFLRLTIDPVKQGWTMISEFRALGK